MLWLTTEQSQRNGPLLNFYDAPSTESRISETLVRDVRSAFEDHCGKFHGVSLESRALFNYYVDVLIVKCILWFFSLQLAWMGVNIYLFVSSFITLQTSKSNFYLRVIVKVNIYILLNV